MPVSQGPFDALLLVSFGGPEGPNDVVPFLENVTRGRGIPRERLVEVGEHYFRFGGRSPINDQCRTLKLAIERDLAAADLDLPVYWGNRNWHPFLADALAEMRDAGIRRAACLFTSAYASYSGCRQYRENLAAAVVQVGHGAPELTRLPHYDNRPGFVEPFVDGTVEAFRELPAGSRLVFVTHSIPTAMNDASGPPTGRGRYVAEHRDVAATVAERVGARVGGPVEWDLVYCSRSGRSGRPWLEPDVNDHLTALAAAGVPGAGVVPIGFVSDHMEVLYDLDTEARATADKLGLPYVRVPTPGTDPRFVAMVRRLLLEGLGRAEPEPAGGLGPVWGDCPAGCCARLHGTAHAACGAD